LVLGENQRSDVCWLDCRCTIPRRTCRFPSTRRKRVRSSGQFPHRVAAGTVGGGVGPEGGRNTFGPVGRRAGDCTWMDALRRGTPSSDRTVPLMEPFGMDSGMRKSTPKESCPEPRSIPRLRRMLQSRATIGMRTASRPGRCMKPYSYRAAAYPAVLPGGIGDCVPVEPGISP